MDITLRAGQPDDARATGTIMYSAFKMISGQHNFPPDFPNPEAAVGLASYMLAHPEIYSVVAEVDGRVVGSNFLWENGIIAGVGPITVDPETQNGSAGRQLMENVMQRAHKRRFAGVRLVQAAYHNRSLSLYTKLGFDAREPLSTLQGLPINRTIPGYRVRTAVAGDLDCCNALCQRVHGYARERELHTAIEQGTATVAEYNGHITAYASDIGFFGHAVAENNEGLKALIGAAQSISGPGFLLPTRNSDVMRWCLQHGLRIVQPMTLMSVGLYNEPKGAFMPSILY